MACDPKRSNSKASPRWLRISLFLTVGTAVVNGSVWIFLAFTKWNAPPPGEGYLWEVGLLLLNLSAAIATGGIAVVGACFSVAALFSALTRRKAFVSLAAHFAIGIFAVAVFYWPHRTTLVSAAQKGDLQKARWALRLGVDPNSRRRMYFHNQEMESVLTIAASRGDAEMVRLLLNSGAVIDRETLPAARSSADQVTIDLILQSVATPVL